MKHIYRIEPMTCTSCKATIEKSLSNLENVTHIKVNLENKEAQITMTAPITLSDLQHALPQKYTIIEKVSIEKTQEAVFNNNVPEKIEKSKLQQLKPLFLILLYITLASIGMHFKHWSWKEFMLDFMGLFYIVFAFFKMLDLKGFPDSFRMYDPLAKQVPVYAKIYPFIETALGILFLMRLEIPFALITTIVILGITTIGVTRALMDKKAISCACLGTALKLPMTQATFIENAIMLIMAILMLIF